MASHIHYNEVFLRSLSVEQLEALKVEAERLSKNHISALTEQLQRLEIK
jgi:hypothetical protein